MATDPEYPVLHRAGIASDGWLRLKEVLDDYLANQLGVTVTNPSNVGSGQILVSDGASGATWTDAGAIPNGSQTTLYTAKPATPDPFNDEFDEGSDVLEDRGFTVRYLGSTVTTPTRSGPVNMLALQGTANTYRSTLRGSSMMIQNAAGLVRLAILKPWSGAGVLAVKATQARRVVNGSSVGLIFLDNLSVGYGQVGGRSIFSNVTGGSLQMGSYVDTTVTYYANASADTIAGSTVFYADINPGSNICTFAQVSASSDGEVRYHLYQQALSGTFNPTYAGALIWQPSAERFSNTSIDFVRRYGPNTWFPTT